MIDTTKTQTDRAQVTKLVVKGKKRTADAPLPCLPRYGG